MSAGPLPERLVRAAVRQARAHQYLGGVLLAFLVLALVVNPSDLAAGSDPIATPTTTPAVTLPPVDDHGGPLATIVDGRLVPGVTLPGVVIGPDGELEPGPRPDPASPACDLDVAADAVRTVQTSLEEQIGPFGTDLGTAIRQLGACQGAGQFNPLDLLATVNAILDNLGVPRVDLPEIPELPDPDIPEELRPALAQAAPTVLRACAEVTKNLITVTALSPALRIDSSDLLDVAQPLFAVCRLFAPQL
jgi:hypothetical protein